MMSSPLFPTRRLVQRYLALPWLTGLVLLTGAGSLLALSRPMLAQVQPHTPATAATLTGATEPTVAKDPLHSPFPLPWAWVEAQQELAARRGQPIQATYASPIMRSPDGMYQASAVLYLQADPDFARNQLTSVLTITDLKTGEQHQWNSSTLIDPDFRQEVAPTGQGLIALLWPAGWSANGDQFLVRQFQGLFASDFASDSAVVWQRDQQTLITLAPQQAEYDHAVVLGWSQAQPNQVLFETTMMGETKTQRWAVDSRQEQLAHSTDRPQVFGQQLPATSQAQMLPPQFPTP